MIFIFFHLKTNLKGIKDKASGMKPNALNAAKDLVGDINCLLGKCKDKTQEKKINGESNRILKGQDMDSMGIINDPYIQMSFAKNSDKELEDNQSDGQFVS